MRVGIVGFSKYLKRAYIPYIKERNDLEIKSVCDIIDPSEFYRSVENAGLNYVPKLFNDLNAMLKSSDFDAIIVSTPHIYHYTHVKACLEAGVHVLVDKPLACQYGEAKILVELAESKGLKLAVGNNRRYEHPYQYIKQAIKRRNLEEIVLINYLFANSPWYDYSKSWRGDSKLSGGGSLIDIGHLAIDMVTWLLEKPLKWVDAVDSIQEDKHVEQNVIILAEFDPNVLFSLTITYSAPVPSVQEELSIYGSQSSIFVRRFCTKRTIEPPLLIEQSKNGEIRHIGFTEGSDPGKPLDDFINGIREGCQILSDGRSNLPTVEFIDAAYRSIHENKRFHLSD